MKASLIWLLVALVAASASEGETGETELSVDLKAGEENAIAEKELDDVYRQKLKQPVRRSRRKLRRNRPLSFRTSGDSSTEYAAPFGSKVPRRKDRATSLAKNSTKSHAYLPNVENIMRDLLISQEDLHVERMHPEFRTSSNYTDQSELSLYGKDIAVQKAILEKEIYNHKTEKKPSNLVQVFRPKKSFHKKQMREDKKTSYKLKDIMRKSKKHMKMIKYYSDEEFAAEMEEGVFLPAEDGTGVAFVPEILVRDVEYILNISRSKYRNSSGSTEYDSGHLEELTRPGRDAQLMAGMPYSFGYVVDDEFTNNYQTRHEEADNNGVVTGCYQVLEPTGLIRTVVYRADHNGFRVLKMTQDTNKTPCTGLKSPDELLNFGRNQFRGSVNSQQQKSINSNIFGSQHHSANSFQNQNTRIGFEQSHNSKQSFNAANNFNSQSSSQDVNNYGQSNSKQSHHSSSFKNEHSRSKQLSSSSSYKSSAASSLLDEISSSGSTKSIINFPFVLIPVSTFIELREKGLIDGSIQSFGAFIQPFKGESGHKQFSSSGQKLAHQTYTNEETKQNTHNNIYSQANALTSQLGPERPKINQLYLPPPPTYRNNFAAATSFQSNQHKNDFQSNKSFNRDESATSYNLNTGPTRHISASYNQRRNKQKKSESKKSSSSSLNLFLSKTSGEHPQQTYKLPHANQLNNFNSFKKDPSPGNYGVPAPHTAKNLGAFTNFPNQVSPVQSVQTYGDEPVFNRVNSYIPSQNFQGTGTHFAHSSKSSQKSSSASSSSSSSSNSVNYVDTRNLPSKTLVRARSIPSISSKKGKKISTSAPIPGYLASLGNSLNALQPEPKRKVSTNVYIPPDSILTETSNIYNTRQTRKFPSNPQMRQSRNLEQPPQKKFRTLRAASNNGFKSPTKMEYFESPIFLPNEWTPLFDEVLIPVPEKDLFMSGKLNRKERESKLDDPVVAESINVPSRVVVLQFDSATKSKENFAAPLPKTLIKENSDISKRNVKNTAGFGQFHTKKSSEKVATENGFKYNTHFYSQA